MNHRLSLVVLVGLVAVAVALAGCTDSASAPQTNTSQTKTYIVGIDVPYPPFSLIDDKGNPTGFDVESMKWIANDQGFKVEFQQTAWDSIIPTLEAGKIDIIYSGMTITDERKEKVNFSVPYWVVNQDIAARNASNITRDDVLAGKAVIGTQRGCTAAMWIEENLVNKSLMPVGNLKTYDNTPLAVEDLAAGRIDVVMYDDLVLKDMIVGKPIKKIGFVETKEEFGIGVRKTDVELLAKINTGLANLKANQAWKDLIAKYKMR
jgi:polar amino acid transport system substrate-binding protein